MKIERIGPLIFAFIITVLLFLLNNYYSVTGLFFQRKYEIIRIIDGDTIELSNGEKVRLIGINAPEKGKRYFDEAKNYLEMLVGEKISLEYENGIRDPYGRLLAYVFWNKRNINVEIVKNGLAHTYKINEISKYKKELLDAENYAIERGIGIWKRSNYSSCIKVNFYYMDNEKLIIKNICNFSINLNKWYIEDESHNVLYIKNFNITPNKEVIICIRSFDDCDYILESKYNIFDKKSDKIFLRDENGLLVFYYKY